MMIPPNQSESPGLRCLLRQGGCCHRFTPPESGAFALRRGDAMKCALCHTNIEANKWGWDKGHNPAPLGNAGDRCCDWCNGNLVIPLRVRMHYLSKEVPNA